MQRRAARQGEHFPAEEFILEIELPFKIEDVANAFSEVQEELRSQYAISYKPADFAADGRYRTIQISAANNKKYKVRARKGYFAPRSEVAKSSGE